MPRRRVATGAALDVVCVSAPPHGLQEDAQSAGSPPDAVAAGSPLPETATRERGTTEGGRKAWKRMRLAASSPSQRLANEHGTDRQEKAHEHSSNADGTF